MPDTPPPLGQVERQVATQRLSQLLKGLHAASPLSWDTLASTVRVDRNTVRNYLGPGLRRRDATILEAMLTAWNAPASARDKVVQLLPATWPAIVDTYPPDSPPDQGRAGVLVVGLVPELAVGFQARDEATRLQEVARPGSATVLTQGGGQTVVSGLGGVGKTQLAAHWARRLLTSGEVDVLVWARAATTGELLTAYADAARTLNVHDAAQSGVSDQESDARRFLVWLASSPRRWALVLDNLDDPTVMRGWWPPASKTGRTVITTRRRDATLLTGRAVVDVDVFTSAAATAFLATRLPAELRGDDTEITALALELGRLPLALGHATAYMIDQGWGCRRYRAEFADRRRELVALFPDDQALFDGATATVATTWTVSVAAADGLTPTGVAGRVLELASHLDAATIPYAVLAAPAALAYTGASDPPTIEAAISNLHRLNLCTRTSDNGSTGGAKKDPASATVDAIGMHALVQRAARDHLRRSSPDRLSLAIRAAADALLQSWPDSARDLAMISALQANAIALYDAPVDTLWDPGSQGGHQVLFEVVTSLGDRGLVDAAQATASRLVELAHTAVGPDHPGTLSARSSLARWRGEGGDAAGAAAAFEQVLNDHLRVLGPEHPRTLSTRGDLAHWRGEAGDAAGAASALEQVLNDHVRMLGADDARTLSTRGDLAYWWGRAGDPARAAAALKELLDDLVRVLGPDDPLTLSTRGNLVPMRGLAGDPAGAAAALELVLDDHTRVLGADHPFTMSIRRALANWRGETGDTAGTAAALEQVLDDQERVLGPDHPRTRATRDDLTYWRQRLRSDQPD